MKTTSETKQWAAEKFGISPEEVLWYNSGSCYDRIGVTTKEAAIKVTEKVRGKTANGGLLHGMSLGGRELREDGSYDVTC